MVEDDRDLRDLLMTGLEDAAYEVVGAADGMEAITALRCEPLDAVVLDVMLPRLDGFEVLEVRNRHDLVPDARFLMYTALADDHSHLRAWRLGCDAYLTKPFSPNEVADQLERLLAFGPVELEDRRRDALAHAEVLDQLSALRHR